MPDERIEVKSYSGYRSDEAPRSFILGDREIEVASIIDRWTEEGSRDGIRRRFFKVRGSDGLIHKLFLNEVTGEWFVRGK